MKAGRIIALLLGVTLVFTGIWVKRQQFMSIGIIGGADGPTSIFVAGKIGSSAGTGLAAVGILVILLLLIWIIKKK